jgi:hypothetical protein
MDDRKPSIPPGEIRSQSASDGTSTAVLSDGGSVVVYYGDEEEVSQGFLIALSAMGVARLEQPPEPAKPPFGRAKP